MRRSIVSAVLLGLSVALLGVGCGSTAATTTTTTTPATTTTEMFISSVNVNGAATYAFTATTAGTVTATLTTVGPDNTVTIGLALGTWNGTACQLILTNDAAVQGAVITGSVSGTGSLCVRVYDVGKLTAAATFEVDIVHP
jgi:hypothetical protein